MLFADCAGYFQEYSRAILPSRIKELSVRMPTDATVSPLCVAEAEPRGFGHAVGSIQCFQGDSPAFLTIEGLQMDQVTGDPGNPSPWMRLVWRLDVDDFIKGDSISSLVPRIPPETAQGIQELECLLQLVIVFIDQEGLEVADSLPPHMHLFRAWLKFHADNCKGQKGPFTPIEDRKPLTRNTISGMFSDSSISNTVDAQLILSVMENIASIFRGETEALGVLLENNKLNRLYEDSLTSDNVNRHLAFVAELLAHGNPNIKILEVGAGTGGATQQILRGFEKTGGMKNYKSYTFTDISAGFFEKARSKFAGWERMEFKTLDIEKDPYEQGFSEKYDLIVASNVSAPASEIFRLQLTTALGPSCDIGHQEHHAQCPQPAERQRPTSLGRALFW